MQRALAYKRLAQFLAQAQSCTTDGVWIAAGRCLTVGDDASDDELAGIVQEALSQSQSFIPHPRQHEWKGVAAPLLKAAGVKSWNKFAEGTACAEIELRNGLVVVTPTMNLGAAGGFESLTASAVPVSAEGLGRLVRQLLAPEPGPR